VTADLTAGAICGHVVTTSTELTGRPVPCALWALGRAVALLQAIASGALDANFFENAEMRSSIKHGNSLDPSFTT
jgi:hypothetical protein